MHGWISFILPMNITHGKVLMHVSQILDPTQYGWLLGSFCTLSYGMCPLPFPRAACMDFLMGGHIQPQWVPNSADHVTLNLSHAWLILWHFDVLPISKHRICVHGYYLATFCRTSFILPLIITHSEVLMHVSQILDPTQYGWLLGSFCTLSYGMCPLPFPRAACMDFLMGGHIQPQWVPNSADHVTLNLSHAWLILWHFDVLPISKHRICVHGYYLATFCRTSFILPLIITHSEVLMHVSQIFYQTPYGWP